MEIDAGKVGLEYAIKKLRRWFNDSGLKAELNSRSFFMTPTQKRKLKDSKARRRKKKMMQKREQLERWG